MNLFNPFGNKPTHLVQGVIGYGRIKKDGGHDHRFNIGDDRTPAQKAGDKKPGKPKSA